MTTGNTSARRTAWMAARARNAAKRGGLIAAVGLLAVATTLVLLVLLPREMNRAVRARIDALPPVTDTLPLQANLTGATDRLRNAEANLQALRVAYTDRIASATSGATVTSPAGDGTKAGVTEQTDARQTEARKELGVRIARARAAPMIENFRAVGEAELLRNDVRARALLDSLNEVNRDREAYAALGSPDARYAAMTARISALGGRMLVTADQRLTSANAIAAPPSVPAPPAAVAVRDSATTAGQSTADTTPFVQLQQFAGDSIAERAARELLDAAKMQLQAADLALKTAREANARITIERSAAEKSSPARVPLIAMLVAALVTGLAFGYGVAFYLEVKRPRIADAAEVERVTETRVITHSGSSRAAQARYPRGVGADTLPPVVDLASESYQLLHITLTGFGDTARSVQVISNDQLIGATVGINLAAAAVRDSRATLLVDASGQRTIVDRLLRQPRRHATTSKVDRGGPESSNVVRRRVGPEAFVDTMVMHDAPGEVRQRALEELVREYDFTVIVQAGDAESEQAIPSPVMDAIICARVGVTKLDWLIARSAELRARQCRVRAVLLWAARAPSSRRMLR